jgi:hypothetical protein
MEKFLASVLAIIALLVLTSIQGYALPRECRAMIARMDFDMGMMNYFDALGNALQNEGYWDLAADAFTNEQRYHQDWIYVGLERRFGSAGCGG